MTSRICDSIAPHSASGGVTPKPRNDRDEAVKIAVPRLSVTLTIIWDMEFGMTWVKMMRRLLSPIVLHASTYSELFRLSTTLRTMRVKPGMVNIVMAMTVLTEPGPSTATMVMASSRPGNASRMSMNRLIIASTQPPK